MTNRGDRGFALLIVLWSLVLLGLLMTRIVASGRTSIRLAENLRAGIKARALADGAINEAVFHVLATGGVHWRPDGTIHELHKGRIIISVRVRSLAGTINPNIASPALLAGLFQALGTGHDRAHQLAHEIILWRSRPVSDKVRKTRLAAYRRAGLPYGPPGRPFVDLSELANIIGMPPKLLAKCKPHMSLYQRGAPNPAFADPTVRRARALAGMTQSGSTSSMTNPVITVDARVSGPGPTSVHRHAIVSIPGNEAIIPFHFIALTTVQ